MSLHPAWMYIGRWVRNQALGGFIIVMSHKRSR